MQASKEYCRSCIWSLNIDVWNFCIKFDAQCSEIMSFLPFLSGHWKPWICLCRRLSLMVLPWPSHPRTWQWESQLSTAAVLVEPISVPLWLKIPRTLRYTCLYRVLSLESGFLFSHKCLLQTGMLYVCTYLCAHVSPRLMQVGLNVTYLYIMVLLWTNLISNSYSMVRRTSMLCFVKWPELETVFKKLKSLSSSTGFL